MADSPLVLSVQVTEEGGQLFTMLGSQVELTAAKFALVWVDTLRHAAKALKISEDDIWEWVERERFYPTTPITEVKPN